MTSEPVLKDGLTQGFMKFFESFLKKGKSTDHYGMPQLRSNEMDFSLSSPIGTNSLRSKTSATHSLPLPTIGESPGYSMESH